MSQAGDGAPADGGADWTAQTAETVERVVGTIRDKTAMPLTTVARAVVFGLLAAIMAVFALVVAAIGMVRVVDAYTGEGNVWIAHLIVGGIFFVAGAFLLRKASATKER